MDRCPSDSSALKLEFSMFSELAENGFLRILVGESWNGGEMSMRFLRDVSSETLFSETGGGVGL